MKWNFNLIYGAIAASLCIANPVWGYSLDPLIAGPVTGINGVNSEWVQVNMNWRPTPGSDKGIISISAAQGALAYDWGSDPADAGFWNSHSGVVSQINFANADFNTTVWPVNGNNVVWGDIYGVRPSAPVFKDSYQNNFAGQFDGYIYIPYSGEWNLGVLVDDGFSFTLNGANSQSLSLLRDGEAPPDLVSFAGNLDLAQGIYSYSMTGYNHLEAGVLALEWWSPGNSWQVVSGSNLFTSATPIPEPAPTGLMLSGLSLVLLVAHRRRATRN